MSLNNLDQDMHTHNPLKPAYLHLVLDNRDELLKVKRQAHLGPRSAGLCQQGRHAFEKSGKNLASFVCHSIKSFVPPVYICTGEFEVREV